MTDTPHAPLLPTAAEIEALFAAPDGYRFARWGRPIAPVVFGVEEATLATVKGALQAVCTLAGLPLQETDPELGANFMVFFLRDWRDLRGVPNLDRLIEGLDPLVTRLEAAEASQYRQFRFDAQGAIRACFLFLRMSGDLAEVAAEDLALAQAAQAILLWGDAAFADRAPLAIHAGHVILRPDIAAVIRAAYDPVLPDATRDPSHALRLAARIGAR